MRVLTLPCPSPYIFTFQQSLGICLVISALALNLKLIDCPFAWNTIIETAMDARIRGAAGVDDQIHFGGLKWGKADEKFLVGASWAWLAGGNVVSIIIVLSLAIGVKVFNFDICYYPLRHRSICSSLKDQLVHYESFGIGHGYFPFRVPGKSWCTLIMNSCPSVNQWWIKAWISTISRKYCSSILHSIRITSWIFFSQLNINTIYELIFATKNLRPWICRSFEIVWNLGVPVFLAAVSDPCFGDAGLRGVEKAGPGAWGSTDPACQVVWWGDRLNVWKESSLRR